MTRPSVRYATPQAMRNAVMAHAKATALARPEARVDQLLRQFAYARLLARLFVLAPEHWVLKGATGLVVRLPSARHSLDVDLWGDRDDVAEVELVKEFLDPVLGGRRDGWWRPERRGWEP